MYKVEYEDRQQQEALYRLEAARVYDPSRCDDRDGFVSWWAGRKVAWWARRQTTRIRVVEGQRRLEPVQRAVVDMDHMPAASVTSEEVAELAMWLRACRRELPARDVRAIEVLIEHRLDVSAAAEVTGRSPRRLRAVLRRAVRLAA